MRLIQVTRYCSARITVSCGSAGMRSAPPTSASATSHCEAPDAHADSRPHPGSQVNSPSILSAVAESNKRPSDAEARARLRLPKPVFDYYAGGAGTGTNVAQNVASLKRIRLYPRMLVRVGAIDTAVTLHLRRPPNLRSSPSSASTSRYPSTRSHVLRLRAPILIAPMAMQALAHEGGESAVASAAARLAVPYVLSTFATTSLASLAGMPSPPPLLFQVYIFRDREVTRRLVANARRLGVHALVLTADAPRFGHRPLDRGNQFRLPPHLSLANLRPDEADPAPQQHGRTALDGFADAVDPDVTYADIRWLSQVADLPVIVKGILRADDAVAAVDAGAAAVIVSNHGGRQLDAAVSTITALPAIVSAVAGRVPVLLDSGIRSGEDVIKALSLGASAVLLGRPVLWALADGGEPAVHAYLQDFLHQISLTMALVGAPDIPSITRDLVHVPPHVPLHVPLHARL